MAAATAQGTYINPMAAITQLPAHTINGINGINGIGNGVVPPPTSGKFTFFICNNYAEMEKNDLAILY